MQSLPAAEQISAGLPGPSPVPHSPGELRALISRVPMLTDGPDDPWREEIAELDRICLPLDAGSLSWTYGGAAQWWVARMAGELVAYAGAVMVPRSGNCYLLRAGVAPAARGMGLQRRLIRVRLRWGREQGAPWAVSDTTDNPHSSNNLIATGFRLYSPAAPWAFASSLYWRYRLQGSVQ